MDRRRPWCAERLMSERRTCLRRARANTRLSALNTLTRSLARLGSDSDSIDIEQRRCQ